MQCATALTWSWLNILTKKRLDAIVQVYGDLDTALESMSEELLKSLGCREETIYKILNRLEEFDVTSYEKELQKRDLTFLTIDDDNYPSARRTIPDPPVFLYAKGDLSILAQPCVALVGSRKMSSYGKRVTEHVVGPLVASGVVTVSGLALGVDAEVAKETLRAGGKNVAVLGHGLGMMYPRANQKIADEILGKGGLILTEFPIDISPDKYTFPARNRIIAGLSLGTVVIEAGKDSGSLITADLALDYGRDVFAVPGQIFDEGFEGCHAVLAKGTAKLVTSAEAILSEVGVVSSKGEKKEIAFQPRDEHEEHLWQVLTTMPQSVGDLSDRSSLDTGTINAALTMMELSGVVKNVGEGRWVKKT